MKILWWSNHPTAATGYGTQTALWCRQLRDAGHEVVISANYGGEPRAHHWEGITVLPFGETGYAQDSLERDIAYVRPDLVWTLYDAWPIDPMVLRDHHVAMWTPVDHNPLPPKVRGVLVESGAVPVAYSRSGHLAMEAEGLDPLYVPHGIDCDVYKPVERDRARNALGLPTDRFIVGMVGANKSGGYLRKGWDVAFESFARIQADHPDMLLYVHSQSSSAHGIDLRACAANYGIRSSDLIFTDAALQQYGMPDEHMAVLYSSFDVLLSPSLGEGFGLPVLEAQACGVPVLVTDFSAQSELCGAGWKAQAHRLYDSSQLSDWGRPYDFEVKRLLAEAYETAGGLREQAREFAVRYDVRQVWDEWFQPTLEILEADVPSTEPIR